MTTLTESALWEEGIYQLEITDPVLGGANGVANLQAKQLANRSLYLDQATNVRGWDVTGKAFAGASLDTKLDNALETVDHGTRLIFPPTDDWLDYDGDHELNTSATTGRHIELVGFNSRIRYRGAGTWLTVAATGPNVANPRTTIRGLILEPYDHWTACALKITNTFNVLIDRCFVQRFGIGIHIHNDVGSWTEDTLIQNCEIRGNRVGILGDADGPTFSQRGTAILNTFVACTYNPAGYDSDRQGDEGDEWHYGVVVRNASWYHGRLLGLGLGLKRSKSCGLLLDGGSLAGQLVHIEGEGDKSLYTNVVGLWLKTSEVGRVSTARAATGTITIMSLGDGDTEEGSDSDPTSQVIYDQRTGVTANHVLGDLRIRGGSFYETPQPLPSVNYQLIPENTVFTDASDPEIGLGGVIDTAGNVQRFESIIHDRDSGFRDWTQLYRLANLRLRTNAYASEIPLAVECCPYNTNIFTVTELVEDDDTFYVDMTEEQPGVLRIATAGDLNQLRGGRTGQVIPIMSLNTGFSLIHFPITNNNALIDQDDVEIGDTTVHFDELEAKIQPGFTFKVAGDTTTYTVSACSDLTSADADVTFTPAATVAWANDAEVTITAHGVFYLAGETDWTTPNARATLSFIYTYHSEIGYFWAQC